MQEKINTRPLMLDVNLDDLGENASLTKKIIAESIFLVANNLDNGNAAEVRIPIYRRWGLFNRYEYGYDEKYIKQTYRDMKVNALARNLSDQQTDKHRISHRFACYIDDRYVNAIFDSDIVPIALYKDEQEQEYIFKVKIVGNLYEYLKTDNLSYMLDIDWYEKKENFDKKIRNIAESKAKLQAQNIKEYPINARMEV